MGLPAMSATLNKNLLDDERNASPKIQRRTVVVSAAVAALILSASFVGYSYGKNAAAAPNPMLHNVTNLDMAFQFSAQCYSYTGHPCSGSSKCEEEGMTCVQNRCLCDH